MIPPTLFKLTNRKTLRELSLALLYPYMITISVRSRNVMSHTTTTSLPLFPARRKILCKFQFSVNGAREENRNDNDDDTSCKLNGKHSSLSSHKRTDAPFSAAPIAIIIIVIIKPRTLHIVEHLKQVFCKNDIV